MSCISSPQLNKTVSSEHDGNVIGSLVSHGLLHELFELYATITTTISNIIRTTIISIIHHIFYISVKMQFTTVELELNQFVKSLGLLAANYKKSIDDLTPELRDAYNVVKTHVVALHSNPGYKVVKQYIAKLTRPSHISHGTLGSYIWGCVQECYGDIDKHCTPLCINSIPYDTNEVPNCQHHIITRDTTEDGEIRLTCLNCNSTGQHINTAMLYVNTDIDTLTGQEIEFLKGLGISQLSILIKDGYKYHKKIDMMPIDRLSTSQPQTSIPKGFIQSPMNIVEKKEEKTDQSNTYLGWILLVVLIIIFLIAIYLFL